MLLTERDQEIVRWTYAAKLTTRDQVHKLFFSAGGRSRCQRRLTLLYRSRFIDKLQRRPISAPAVYYVSRRCSKGLRLLRALSPEDQISPRSAPPGATQHTVEIGDCRVALAGACAAANYTLSAWIDEETLLPRMQGTGLLPDAYFQITRRIVGEPKVASFFLEVERSGKSERAIAERFRRYGDFYYSGRYAERFRTEALRVLFLVGDEYGIDPNRQIARFASIAAKQGVTIFRFAALQEFNSQDVSQLLFVRFWHRPGDEEGRALFEH